jgi:hypothetical protein
MKRILGTAVFLALLAVSVVAPLASAQCVTGTGVNVLLKWDANGFSYETGAPYTNYVSPAGNVLTNVLGVSLFCAPLSGLDPNDPAKEYTMVWTGLVSGGTVTTPFGASGSKYSTVYTGGAFALYEGPVNARAWTAGTVPAPGAALGAYTDGTIVLSGSIDSLTTTITKSSLGTVNGSFRGKYRVTGGTLANLFCPGGAAGLMDGLWFPVAPPAGYTGHNNGKFDAPDCTTPAKTTSWGRIKTMYR